MDSNLSSPKCSRRNKDTDILKYFKKKKASDTSSAISSSVVTSNNSTSNEELNLVENVTNSELTVTELIFGNEVSTQANSEMMIRESGTEDEPTSSN